MKKRNILSTNNQSTKNAEEGQKFTLITLIEEIGKINCDANRIIINVKYVIILLDTFHYANCIFFSKR